MLLGRRKGITAKEAEIHVATTWNEFQPDEYDGSEDGDDSVQGERLVRMGLIDQGKVAQHKGEG